MEDLDEDDTEPKAQGGAFRLLPVHSGQDDTDE